MSQDDLTVANDTRTNVRTKIQAGLRALGSTSKGPTRPATAYDGQLWVDDNTPSSTIWTLYLYEGGGDIALGTIDTVNDVFIPIGGASGVPAGTVCAYAGNAAPAGWVYCDGASLLRAGTYSNLFAAVGTTYGSVDGTHFNVPDIQGRSIFGRDDMSGSAQNRITNATMSPGGTTRGATGGEQRHTLTAAEQASMSIGGLSTGTPGGSNLLTLGVNSNVFEDVGLTAVGGGGPHNNMPPAIVLNYIIKY